LTRLEAWFHTVNAYKVRYEELYSNPVETLKGIEEDRISEIVAKNSFSKKAGQIPGEEAKDSPARKGIVGDWKNYFDAECVSTFKAAYNGRWNKLLIELGYENSKNLQNNKITE